jgi:hypothetical protein
MHECADSITYSCSNTFANLITDCVADGSADSCSDLITHSITDSCSNIFTHHITDCITDGHAH